MTLTSTGFALVRDGIPESYATNCLTDVQLKDDPIQLSLARVQHAAYVAALAKVVEVIRVPLPTKDCPDSVFVEDTVVLAGDTAVLTQPGAPSRRPEVDTMEAFLKDAVGTGRFPSLKKVVRMSGEATLDGGDVLNTGKHIFVGLSKRSNAAGVAFLAEALHHTGITVSGVNMKEHACLHLKCVITMLCSDTLLYADTPLGKLVRAHIERVAAPGTYTFIAVPEQVPSNVLCVTAAEPGRVKALLVQDGFPASQKIIREAMRARGQEDAIVELGMSEIIKGDGALTCMSVLVPQ